LDDLRDIDNRTTGAKRPKPVNRVCAATGQYRELVRAAIEGIRYGVVQVIIQDGKILQIDRTEKMRLARQIGWTKPFVFRTSLGVYDGVF
jgi:hypothetical protein